MFDWNDEELRNIIWGEIEDDRNKKEWRSQEATAIRPAERKTAGAKIDFNGGKMESSSNSASGFVMGSWFDQYLSNNAAKTGIAKSNSTSSAMKAELDKDLESFENPEGIKDQSDFVDYTWANIGGFDDLDQIFSNDDPIFGNASLETADELWSSSKGVTNSPVKSFPLSDDSPSLELGALKNTSEHVDVKFENEQQDDKLLILSHGKVNNPARELQRTHSTLDIEEYAGGKIKSFEKERTDLGTKKNATASMSGLVAEHVATLENSATKGYIQKNQLRGRRQLEENSQGKFLPDMCGTALSQQRQLPNSETLQYQQTNSFVTPSEYGNLTNPYPAMPAQSGKFKHQSLSPWYDDSPGKANLNKSVAAPAKPTMTPQEKIEKLRRRQQMQAMLAIRKQQRQFSHQVSRDHSNPQRFQENQIQLVAGDDLEVGDLSHPSFDPNSPVEQDDSNTIYLADDNNPVADTILYRLQNVIAQLDLRIRLCIRDSLFRLAQSAMKRHYTSDASSTNKSGRDKPEVVTKADSNPPRRYPRMADTETETNPIDRIVAHLLFHRPLDLPGKQCQTPESPVSNKLQCEHATMSLVNLPMSCMPDSSKITQNRSHHGPIDPCSVTESQLLDQFQTSSCMDTSENTSNYGPVDSGATEVEASQ